MEKNLKRKKLFSLILSLTFIAAALFTSCKNDSSGDSALSEPAKNGTVKIILQQPKPKAKKANARTVLPEVELDKITLINLKGVHDGQLVNIATWDSSSQLNSADPLSLDLGDWELTLTATLDNGCTFSDSKSVEIVLAENKEVTFTLESDSDYGGISLHFNLANQVRAATFELRRYSNNSLVDEGELTVQTDPCIMKYERNPLTNPLVEDTYRIIFNFYADSAKSLLLNTYSEIIRVRGGFTSTAIRTLDLNNLYHITWQSNLSDTNGDPIPAADLLVSGELVEAFSLHSSSITLPVLEKSGYIFDGWYSDSGLNDYVTGQIFTIDSSTDMEDKIFFAKWRKIYLITYKIATHTGITVPMPSSMLASYPSELNQGEEITLPAPSFTDGEEKADSAISFISYNIDSSSGPALTGNASGYILSGIAGHANAISDNVVIYILVNPHHAYINTTSGNDNNLAFNVNTPAKSVEAAMGWLKGADPYKNPVLYAMTPISSNTDIGKLSNLSVLPVNSGQYGGAILKRHSSMTTGCMISVTSGSAEISDVTIDGGAVWYKDGASLPANTCVSEATNNTSAGGVSTTSELVYVASNATLTMSNVNMQNNDNTSSTGKTFALYGTADLTTCTIKNCKSDLGGGMYVIKKLTARMCEISYNYATTNGGGLNVSSSADVTLDDVSFFKNKATLNGGAIYNIARTEGKPLTFRGSFNGNSCGGNGSNIYDTGLLNFSSSSSFNSGDIYYDNESNLYPITFASTAAFSGSAVPITITPAAYYSTNSGVNNYDKQVFNFTGLETSQISTLLTKFKLANTDYFISNNGYILTEGSMTVTPGFPGTYSCGFEMDSANNVKITIKDSSGDVVPDSLISSIKVTLYETGAPIKEWTSSSFTYPSFLNPPTNTSFYVEAEILPSADSNVAYSYDFYALEPVYVGSIKPYMKKSPGDIIFSDGSAESYTSVTASQKAHAVAVIFYSGNAGDALGERTLGYGFISVYDTKKWSSNDYVTVTTSSTNGAENMAAVRALCSDESDFETKFPAFYQVYNYGVSVGGSTEGWYLSGKDELQEIYDNRALLADALAAVDKGNFFTSGYWWSSTMVNSERAYDLYYSDSNWYSSAITSAMAVCFVREF